jgi:CPA2 family monovalent cation:H+ antiporter-2
MSLGLLPHEGRDAILAGALLSITLNPLAFALVGPLQRWLARIGGVVARLDAAGSVRLQAVQRAMEESRAAAEAAAQAKLSLQIHRLMQAFPMFAPLTHEQREELLSLFKPHFAAPGERLIRAGDVGDRAFFLSSGAVEVVRTDGERIRLGPGELFGEMALLTGERRTADVIALDYCELLMIEERDFRQFAERCPELHAEIDRVAMERLGRHRREPGNVPEEVEHA